MENKVVALNNVQELITYNEEQVKLIKNMYAKNFTNDELGLMMYMSKQYGLDILTKQIWGVKFGNTAAQIYCGRDGFLEIAHRSGKFDGIESGTTGSKKTGDLKGWCKVYRTDMSHPFYVEVDFEEYTTGKSLWASKPKTMIQKVSESQCLRKAFSISGIYGPEEMSQWEEENKNKTPQQSRIKMMDKAQKATIWKIAQDKGMDIDELKQFTMKAVGTPLNHLTYEQAEELYNLLSKYTVEPKEEVKEENKDNIIDAEFTEGEQTGFEDTPFDGKETEEEI